ncbi:SPOR domain-containing protein [Geopsychrobacter electrodiphilus]|uniref:SPOR domain-containing protein n=1 Tax=Geopsychrobacter electrodiphilus TaxID=225196 RepID=UPI0003813727|nr:SPOR domain-containing protein [Geopsychrobacter electrodiphilus]
MSQEEIGQRSTDETPRSSDFVDRASEHTAISPELVVGERPSSKSRGVKLLLFLMLVVVMGCVIYYLLGQYIVDVEPSATSGALTSVIKINRPDSPVIPLEEGVKVEIVPVEKLASVEPSPPRVAASNPEVDPVPMVVAPAKAVGTPAYVLASGRYLYSDKLNKAISQIEKMGYKTTRTSINEEHKMTRLLLNRFDTKAMAEKRLAEILPKIAGAFIVAEAGKFALYAGSYLSLDMARRDADYLFAEGIRTVESSVSVALPRTTLTFGSFATRDEALKVADKLKKKGVLAPKVVSNS